nr:methyl-accepting chemotaxis protein [uncultured Alsobacter sp.]
MSKLSLRSVLYMIVAALVTLGMTQAGVGLYSQSVVKARQAEVTDNWTPSIIRLSDIKFMAGDVRAKMNRAILSDIPEAKSKGIDEARLALEATDAAIADYDRTGVSGQEERALFDAMVKDWRAYVAATRAAGEADKAGRKEEAEKALVGAAPLAAAATKRLADIVEYNRRNLLAEFDRIDGAMLVSSIVNYIAIAASILMGLLAFWVVQARAVSPIAALTDAMRRLSGGELQTTIPNADRTDEIGQMAGAVQVFKENAIRVKALEEEEKKVAAERLRRAQSMVEVVGEVGEVVRRAADGDFSARLQVATDDPEMSKLVAGINEINQVVDAATGEFAEVLGSLAQGDLTRSVQTSYRGRFGELKEALNETIDRLSVTVTTIQGTAREVSAAAGEINTGANDLSSRTEQQASSLEETAATTEELAASVKASAASSRNAVDLAEQAMAVAREGGSIATKAVDAMSRIESASQKISDITGVIDEIAFQTNLLALNAAVEAARAGDAGKGFAVVASEVRTLAQRSSEAAKEITALINASVSEVGQGVQLVRSAGDALGKIVEASQKVTATVTDISTAAAEQANGIDEMSQAVAHMDEMTQQNAALAEESAASASSLSDQITRLNDLVAAFKVSGSGTGTFGTPTIPHALRERAQQAFAGAKPRTPTKASAKAAPAAPAATKAAGRTGTWDEF